VQRKVQEVWPLTVVGTREAVGSVTFPGVSLCVMEGLNKLAIRIPEQIVDRKGFKFPCLVSDCRKEFRSSMEG